MSSIRCGSCRGVHGSVAEVRTCYTRADEAAEERRADRMPLVYAETAALRDDADDYLDPRGW